MHVCGIFPLLAQFASNVLIINLIVIRPDTKEKKKKPTKVVGTDYVTRNETRLLPLIRSRLIATADVSVLCTRIVSFELMEPGSTAVA